MNNGLREEQARMYPCISDRDITSRFHDRHRQGLENGRLTARYNDDCIYTPDAIVFKTDTAKPESTPEEEWYRVERAAGTA